MLDRFILTSLLAFLVLFAIPYGAVEPWWESIFECAVFGLTTLWIIEGLLSGTWRLSGYRLLAPLLALVTFAFLQSYFSLSADPYETRRFAFKLLALALTGILLRSYVYSQRRFSLLVHTVIFVGVASAIFGILRQTMQNGAALDEGFVLPFLRPGEGYGQFINRNHFAFLMEMTVGLALGLVAGGGARRDRALMYIAMAIPLLTGMALSSSRGGVLSLLGQVMLFALMFSYARGSQRSEGSSDDTPTWLARLEKISRATIARFSLAGCLALALAVGVVWIGGDPLVSRFEALSGDIRAANAGQSRVDIWQATLGLASAHPIAGVGLGAYAVAIASSHDSSGERVPLEAHNDYLELLASGGVIGGLLGLWFVLVLIKIARAQLRSTDPFRRAACFGAMIGLFGVAAHSLVDFGLHITINALIFTALAVIATLDGGVIKPIYPGGDRDPGRQGRKTILSGDRKAINSESRLANSKA